MRTEIYLDHAASSPIRREALNAMNVAARDPQLQANPSSIHHAGTRVHNFLERCRDQVAALACHEMQVVFTSGGSEANTLAIAGCAEYLKKTGKTHVIASSYEHKSVENALKFLEKNGFTVTRLPVKCGIIKPEDLQAAITEQTGLVSIMRTNNELGTMNPVKLYAALCRSKGILFHSDYVQAVSEELICPGSGLTMASVSAHKLGGPKGIGCLFVRDPSILSPVVFGGGQEGGLRGGTENIVGIAGFAAAAEEAFAGHTTVDPELKPAMLERLKRIKGFESNSWDSVSSNRILSVRFEGVDGESLALLLSLNGVYVSTGSACNASSVEPSQTLLAAGLTEDQARRTIRISFGRQTSKKEVLKACDVIEEAVFALRRAGN